MFIVSDSMHFYEINKIASSERENYIRETLSRLEETESVKPQMSSLSRLTRPSCLGGSWPEPLSFVNSARETDVFLLQEERRRGGWRGEKCLKAFVYSLQFMLRHKREVMADGEVSNNRSHLSHNPAPPKQRSKVCMSKGTQWFSVLDEVMNNHTEVWNFPEVANKHWWQCSNLRRETPRDFTCRK